MRMPKRMIPNKPSPCYMEDCVYNKDKTCDDPRTNKGNSDASCHGWTNRHLVHALEEYRYEAAPKVKADFDITRWAPKKGNCDD